MTSGHDDSTTAPNRWDGDTDSLWAFVQTRGMGRRNFLRLIMLGGAAAVLAACGNPVLPTVSPVPAASPPNGAWFKDPAPFVAHGETNLEARLANMEGLITPTRHFFMRNNSASLDLTARDWRLAVEGDGVGDNLELSYDELRSLPRRVLVSYLECGGNHRVMFDLIKGRAASGTQWGTGAIGNGEWVGASLRDVLTLAGVRDDAISVLLIGLDTESPEGGFRRVISMEKAMHPDTLLAYALNGEDLPRDHGYPVRALVPGWVGSSSIKWLGRIVVSTEQQWTRNNTKSYVLIGDSYPPEGEADGTVANEQSIKSALALAWPGEMRAGQHRLHGYAHSPNGPISRVEWSTDSGASWRDADVLEPQPQYSWARFEFLWDAAPGERTIMTRATDVMGNTQPDEVPFNEKGYLFNQPLPHPIRVT